MIWMMGIFLNAITYPQSTIPNFIGLWGTKIPPGARLRYDLDDGNLGAIAQPKTIVETIFSNLSINHTRSPPHR